MELREPRAGDGEPVEDVVERAMTASFALSPDEIRAVLEARFDPAATGERWDDDDVVARVAAAARDDDEASPISGYVEADAAAEEVRWLFVHPDHRGAGVGTTLFEAATDALTDRGVDEPRASTREANREGGKFFERFDYEPVDERTVEIGGQSLVEYVYAPAPSEAEKSDRAASEDETQAAVAGGSAPTHGQETDEETWAKTDFPGTERREEGLAVDTDERTVYVDDNAPATGREAPFFPVFEGPALDEQYGFYCGNCGSLDAIADEMERIECADCGNLHAADAEYDGSYL